MNNVENETRFERESNDAKRIVKAFYALEAASPITQIISSAESLFESYTRHELIDNPITSKVRRDYYVLKRFLEGLKEITTTSEGPPGYFRRELEAVGKTIRALRISSGQDERTIADAIGIKVDRLRQIEQGECGEITVTMIARIGMHFNIHTSGVFAGIRQDKFRAPEHEGTSVRPTQNQKELDDGLSQHPSARL
ncbi:helix-turn-helix domain-containing protein [Fulvivirgaceae bacterium PWU5]|uniref:Helix-turn-helix domain-containing protein n=1 Tax=Dawidia cretensis TaxID=2782350 RepID=A0AAP2E5P3_9BACT|nr:helix-turn-helix transcriptional regulator [Dawidia cretensis]MBT1712387.1 helix-turn-helix domain-containing protein [Dawidia cretensis]